MKPSFPQQRSSHLVVTHPDRQDLPVVAILGASGVNAPRKAETAVPPRPSSGALAMPVTASIGDYRAGDLLWLERLAPDRVGDRSEESRDGQECGSKCRSRWAPDPKKKQI